MKAISVQQPWAHLLCAGIKDVERRTWKTPCREKVLIHASSKKVSKNVLVTDCIYPEGATILNAIYLEAIPFLDEMETSAIIGYVDIVDCSLESDSIWGDNSGEIYNWKIDNAYLFDEPIRNVKGKLHFFDVPEIDENNLPPAHKVDIGSYIVVNGDIISITVPEPYFESALESNGLKEIFFEYTDEFHFLDMMFKDADKSEFIDSSQLRLVCGDRENTYEIVEFFIEAVTTDDGEIVTYSNLNGEQRECQHLVIQYCRDDEYDEVVKMLDEQNETNNQ